MIARLPSAAGDPGNGDPASRKFIRTSTTETHFEPPVNPNRRVPSLSDAGSRFPLLSELGQAVAGSARGNGFSGRRPGHCLDGLELLLQALSCFGLVYVTGFGHGRSGHALALAMGRPCLAPAEDLLQFQ